MHLALETFRKGVPPFRPWTGAFGHPVMQGLPVNHGKSGMIQAKAPWMCDPDAPVVITGQSAGQREHRGGGAGREADRLWEISFPFPRHAQAACAS